MDLKPLFDGGGTTRPLIVAGPCGAESRSQMEIVAKAVAACGASVLRAGAWKPRTKPGGFEGYGDEALPWIVDAAHGAGLRALTEVASAHHVRAALDAGIDMLWIGARTSSNPFAVQEIADELAIAGRDVPVLVKNPVSPDLELWIGALERLNAAGVKRLAAIHRGFSSYGENYYRNTPLWRVPIELHRRVPDLPIICDPSHIAGRREIVGVLAQQAVDMGFDGLMIEVHPSPEAALSDARQQLAPGEFSSMMAALILKSNYGGDVADLTALRGEIDELDDRLLALLAQRMQATDRIGSIKHRLGMPVVQPERYRALMDRRTARAAEEGLDADFVRAVLAAIHEESVRRQLAIAGLVRK